MLTQLSRCINQIKQQKNTCMLDQQIEWKDFWLKPWQVNKLNCKEENQLNAFLDLDNLPTDSIGIFKLNDLTFDPFINKNQVVVVKFVIPGCAHCTSYKKIYDDVVLQFLMEESEDVKFAEIDCRDKDSLNVCSEEGVQSFPTTHTYKVK